MTCPRCHGLIIVVREQIETIEVGVQRCLACGMRVYPPYMPEPMRAVMMKGRRE